MQSVLLLTDGLANEGIKSKDGILGEMRKLQDSKKVRVVGRKKKKKRRGSHISPVTMVKSHLLRLM